MSDVKYKFFDYGIKEIEYLSLADPVLGDAMARLGRVEREVIPDPFSALVYAIIGQLISTSSAKTVWKRLQERIGEITPENFSDFTPDDVKQCGMTMKKAICISDLAKAITGGDLSLDSLVKLPDIEIIRRLTSFRGIGQWTAEMLLINMDRPDIVSWGDIAIRRGIEKLYGTPNLTKKQFESYKNRYSPYGSVASIYLWAISSTTMQTIADAGGINVSDMKITDEEKWQASCSCDSDYDGKFFYGVKTTGIFCRPSCKSKSPKRENVVFFDTARQAEAGGLRPCKRCRPDLLEFQPLKESADKIKAVCDLYFADRNRLKEELAGLGLSKNRMIQLFKEEYKKTPSEYLNQLRIDRAKELLAHTQNSILHVSLQSGFENLSTFYVQFKKMTGMSPKEYRGFQV